MNHTAEFIDWNEIDYKAAWDKQEVLFNQILEVKNRNRAAGQNNEATNNFVVFCEHPHVYTLGKSGSDNNLLINSIQLQANNATFYHTNRGGDITYHGPGQIVGYPILDLENFGLGLKEYIHQLEEVIILTIAEYGITGTRLDGATGVWLDVGNPGCRKICAIGVRSGRYITMHGFALNVATDLRYFSYINPCGFIDKGVTSLEKELGLNPGMAEVKEKLKKHFVHVFGLSWK